MTEQLPAGRRIYPDVAAMNTPAELSATFPSGHLAATLDPLALYVRNEGQWVPLASVAGDIPAPTLVGASEEAAGVAELATQEETNTGSDAFRIVTPARLSGRAATEGRSGVVEEATTAEVRAGTAGVLYVPASKMKAEFDRRLAPEAWIAPTLLNGWVNFGVPKEVVGYRKTPSGEVVLKGAIKDGTTVIGTVFFNLPAGYRPAKERDFDAVRAGGDTLRVTVETNGNVVVNGSAQASVTLTSLEGIRFDV